MANLSEFAANAILDGDPMPTTLWVQLHVGDPGVTGVANVAAEDRRMSFTRTAAAAGACSNAGSMLWDSIPDDETITHISIHDDESAGDAWWIGDATSDLIVTTGNNIALSAGALDLSLLFWS